MRALELRITNFRSVKEEQVFRFPEEAGLYFMRGVNEVEPRLEGNAAGKTTIWDAFTWLWFGKTARGLKAGDVCNWDIGKGTVVEFDYDDPGIACVWTVRRTWGPNSWTLSHVAEFITDEEVIDLTKAASNEALAALRLEFAPFLNSILTAQRAPMFLDLGKEAQAALFSDVLGLDRWLEYSNRASKKAATQDSISRKLERDLSNLRGQLEAIGTNDFRQSAEQWDMKRKKRVDDLAADHAALVEKSKRLKTELEQAQEKETNARAAVSVAQPNAGDLKDHGRAVAEVSDYTTMIVEKRLELAAVKSHLEHLNANETCPTCNQSLNRADLAKEQRRAEKGYASTKALLTRIEGSLVGAKARADRLGEDLDAADQKLRDARSDLDDALHEVSSTRRNLDLNERELDRLEEDVARIEAEANPYAEMEDRARRDGERLREDIDDAQWQLDESNSRHALLSFWVRGFKELRLVQIAEALTELEVEVNSCVTSLGLVDWELNFQVDRETRGGSIQRGFNTFVKSPHNERPVPWEAWSGGEGQRLRIAATMGLANLIRSRTGATLNLEVWDEPTQGLSPQGVADLLEALATRARTDDRQIWVIDHTSHDFGGFAGGAVITKKATGSVIEQH